MKRIIAAIMIVFLLFPGFAAAAPGNYGSPGGEQIGNGETNMAPGEGQRLRAEENEASRDRVRAAENATPPGENSPLTVTRSGSQSTPCSVLRTGPAA